MAGQYRFDGAGNGEFIVSVISSDSNSNSPETVVVPFTYIEDPISPCKYTIDGRNAGLGIKDVYSEVSGEAAGLVGKGIITGTSSAYEIIRGPISLIKE
ncbi:MAG: hypothetical protein RIR39_484 [Pseudomonadota bacterium]|jgi:hypothetical protein